MELSDWLVVSVYWKAVLKYVTVDCGEQSVAVDGTHQMQQSYASN